MNITYDFLYGFAFGIIIAGVEENEELGQEWGFMLLFGPLVLDISKPT
mgnify:FL=1